MKCKCCKFILMITCLCLILTSSVPDIVAVDVPLKEKFQYSQGNENSSEYYNFVKYPYYATALKEYEKNGCKPANDATIIINASEIIISDQSKIVIDASIYDKGTPVFLWDESINVAEIPFEIENEGLYNLEIVYRMPDGSGNPAVRALSVDGSIPFLEANNIVFRPMWKDEGEPRINSLGDETRPGQVQVQGWTREKLHDSEGLYSEPFKFYMKTGEHVIKLEFVEQTMIISEIIIRSAEEIPIYETVVQQYREAGYQKASKTLEFQAESSVLTKNDPTLRRESNSDPTCRPESYINRKLNVIGDWNWRQGNQSITWQFSVEEAGLFKIGVRTAQWWNDGLPSCRQIAIDGSVPYQEFEEYSFKYSRDWYTETLKNPSGDAYLIYLDKGDHTLTMTVKLGSITPIVLSLNDDAILLSKIIGNIIKITGNNPDPNYDYELMKTIPSLEEDMTALEDSLQKKYDYLKSLNDRPSAMANNFLTIKSQLINMINDPFIIAGNLDDLNNALTSLVSWYQDLQDQPLLIDYFLIGAPDEKWKDEKAGLFQRLRSTIANFAVSFIKDYDNIGHLVDDNTEIKSVINVWVSRGSEWVELIKEMTDEDFTTKTGIMVNMNVFPSSQLNAGSVNALMLAISSGKAPDAALGVDSGSPVEFAIRNAVYDLSKFSDYDEVAKRFIPNIFIPYKYQNGIYAIPETMNFTVLFYRKDIISDLNIKLPETREDIYNYVLPVLYQNGLEFYYPADFNQFLFQHGAEYYTSDMKKSALDTPEAFRAFKECSELYTNYGIPVSANFFNRFRTGEMPMGIGNYSTYITLAVSAPELAGRWGIAPLPGIKKADGTIDRSCGGLAGQCDIILNQSDNKDDAWKFISWWTSAPVQTMFARQIESLVGVEARWNSANYEAFTNLSWDKDDLEVIKEQWKWAREMPVVLGGYFSSRHLNNAWNKVIINGESPRDAMEEAVEFINRELRMKQEEYGIK